jgi:hypothetical protein
MSASGQRSIVAVCAVVALTACQWAQEPRRSPLATSPTPVPTAPPPADFEGRFTLTFSAAQSCADIPQALRTRVYEAEISRHTAGSFKAELSGATFFPNYGAFFVAQRPVGARLSLFSVYAMDRWIDELPVFERLPSGAYLALNGQADVPIQKDGTSWSVPFSGTFSYCALPTVDADPAYAPRCSKALECQSSMHDLMVTRR